MKMAIMSEEGINFLVDKKLREMTLDKRIRYQDKFYEFKPDFMYLPKTDTYSMSAPEIDGGKIIVDLLGPYDAVPNSVVAGNHLEMKILKEEQLHQHQLVVLERGIFRRNILSSPSLGKSSINSEGTVYFGNQNEGWGPTIISQDIRNSIIEHAIERFVPSRSGRDGGITFAKIIYEEPYKQKIIDVLEKMGMKKED